MDDSIELLTILKELHNISGFRISIYDNDVNEICAYPNELSPFCQLIQKNPKGLICCKDYDRKAFEKVNETGTTYIYRCKFGLYEAVSPLYHFGFLSGYLMMGQTLDTFKHSISYTYDTAKLYCNNYTELESAINSIPISTKDKITSCITIMNVCASYITLSNRLKRNNEHLTIRIKKYINENYSKSISLNSLCDEFYCSKSTLTNSFKAAYNVSVQEYITEVRMEKAKVFLANQSATINEVSQLCGFRDQNYFSKVFSAYFGISPSKYRSIP